MVLGPHLRCTRRPRAFLYAARPVMRWLAEVSSESATLHLLHGYHRVLVVGAQANDEAGRRHIPVGERAPLTSGCGAPPSSLTSPLTKFVT